MDIQMIVTDLDGTLFRTDKTVSAYTRDVLQRCRELGIRTAIATARGNPEKMLPTEQSDAKILCNGALIVVDGAVHKQTIPYKIARPLLLACEKRGMRVTSQYGGTHYSSFDVAAVWPHIRRWEQVDFSRHDIDTEKINIESITAEDVAYILENIGPDMHLQVARDGLGMIMHTDATKSKAVAKLAKIWGISEEKIVCFGDDVNDIDMLRSAGISVAMDNALPEVKAVAKYVCDSNDNDGVARWLEEHVLRG